MTSGPPGARHAVVLSALVRQRVSPEGWTWLTHARDAIERGAPLVEPFALAGRKLGKAVLQPTVDESGTPSVAGIPWPIAHWGVDEAARVMLLLAASQRLDAAAFAELLDDSYRTGATRERTAVLRALPLLPAPEQFVDVAIDACRTSVQSVFEAIACENPYPAAHFPELNFNQMVLKALFIGVAVARIIGLDERLTPELARMASDYASERRAAGRSVPPDIGRLLREITA